MSYESYYRAHNLNGCLSVSSYAYFAVGLQIRQITSLQIGLHLSHTYFHTSLALSLFRDSVPRRQPGRLKRLPSTDYRMLKALPRTNHPAGSSWISEQSNDSVIRLSRFVDKILPSFVMNLIGSPKAMEELNYDERISGKCTDVARASGVSG